MAERCRQRISLTLSFDAGRIEYRDDVSISFNNEDLPPFPIGTFSCSRLLAGATIWRETSEALKNASTVSRISQNTSSLAISHTMKFTRTDSFLSPCQS